MLQTYLNALWVMECENHKKMMSKIDDNVEDMYSEFETNSILLRDANR